MPTLYSQALAELAGVFDRLDDAAVDRAVRMIAEARTVFIFGCGRVRLQIMGLAMRLFHLGRRVAVVARPSLKREAPAFFGFPPILDIGVR